MRENEEQKMKTGRRHRYLGSPHNILFDLKHGNIIRRRGRAVLGLPPPGRNPRTTEGSSASLVLRRHRQESASTSLARRIPPRDGRGIQLGISPLRDDAIAIGNGIANNTERGGCVEDR